MTRSPLVKAGLGGIYNFLNFLHQQSLPQQSHDITIPWLKQ